MEINADFTRPATVIPDSGSWRASPLPGVERLMLDRVGDEVARATSIVRYAPDSRFSAHTHDLGEEFLVLDGIFSDASGDFPPGSYVRNPPGTSHAPWSEGGCTIFVKLRQFALDDTDRVALDTLKAGGWMPDASTGGETLALHRFGDEEVDLLRLPAGADLTADGGSRGLELFVMEGSLTDRGNAGLPNWSWLRLPPGETRQLTASEPSILYRKTGHL